MRLRSRFLIIAIAMFMLVGGFVVNTSAQSRGSVTVQRQTRRPVVVRRAYYRDPFWRSRYWNSRYWGYDPYWDSPYLRYQDQKIRLQNELAGNRRELQNHLEKYRADGVITAKEQRELDDDYKDVRESEARLRQFTSNYAD